VITPAKRLQHYATIAAGLAVPLAVIMLILVSDLTNVIRVGALLIALSILLHMLTRPDLPTGRPTRDHIRRALTGAFPELKGDRYADELADVAWGAVEARR
jgi:hypothetical protein